MSRAGLIRLAVIIGAIAALEAACRAGVIGRESVIAPSLMLQGAWRALAADDTRADIALTLQNVTISFVLSVAAGLLAGLALHRATRLRRAVEIALCPR